MKKFVLALFVLMASITLAHATIVSDGGVAYTPVTKTDTGLSRTETDKTVWTPASGNKIVLMGVSYSSTGSDTLLVENGTTAVIPTMQYTASGVLVVGNGTPIWKGEIDEKLTYTTTGPSTKHSILMWGYESNI